MLSVRGPSLIARLAVACGWAWLVLIGVPSSAGAAADGGWLESNTNLSIRPENDPVEMSMSQNYPVMVVQMPVSKRVQSVELGHLRHACSTGTPTVRVKVELHTDGDPWGYATTTTLSTNSVPLPASPGPVKWDLPPLTMRKGDVYVFKIVPTSGCTNWRMTTWRGSGPVYGGDAECALSAGDISWYRAAPTGDGCGAWNYQPSMPVGWLVVKPCSPGDCKQVVTRDATTQPTNSCAGTTWLNGGKWTYWRESVTPGRKDYVCVWDQYMPSGNTPKPPEQHGWHYATPWLGSSTALGRNGAPRDMWLTLETIDYGALLQKHVPLLKYDSNEPFFADDAREMTDTGFTWLIRQFHDDDPEYGSWPPIGAQKLAEAPGLEALGAGYPAGYAYAKPDGERDQLFSLSDPYVARDWFYANTPQWRDQVYGRVAYGEEGTLWLQYWMFYYHNSYQFAGIGTHPGDWELIQIALNDSFEPYEVTYSQHEYAESCSWSKVRSPYDHDVAQTWVADGSHANYTFSGDSEIDIPGPTPGPTDSHWGDGYNVRPNLQVVSGELLSFWGWPGRWGTNGSPRGPMTQGSKWTTRRRSTRKRVSAGHRFRQRSGVRSGPA